MSRPCNAALPACRNTLRSYAGLSGRIRITTAITTPKGATMRTTSDAFTMRPTCRPGALGAVCIDVHHAHLGFCDVYLSRPYFRFRPFPDQFRGRQEPCDISPDGRYPRLLS